MTCKKFFACVTLFFMMFAVGADAEILSGSTMKKLKKAGKAGKKLIKKHDKDIKKAGKKAEEKIKEHFSKKDEPKKQAQPQQQPQTQTVIVREEDRLFKSSSTNNPAGELENNLKAFARNFLVNNDANMEIQLQANELPRNAGVRFNKLCAKNRTIVAGDSGSNRNYRPFAFMTMSENFTFSGGIRVGAPVRTVENFFVQRARDIETKPGRLHFETGSRTYIDILYDTKSGNITQIGYYDTNGTNCSRTRTYMRQKAKDFGFKTSY